MRGSTYRCTDLETFASTSHLTARSMINRKPLPGEIADRIAEIYATESRRILATLIRLLGDIDRAEEALQEAFGVALTTWPSSGIPRNPRAWLVSTGKFKAIDAMRREGRGRELINHRVLDSESNSTMAEYWDDEVVRDDQLRLIFTCCHPLLPIDARIALCLRELCGLSTVAIARGFLVSVEAMKKRISRTKASIRREGIPYEIPSRSQLPQRLDAVLHVVYLLYNEGYSTSSGSEPLRPSMAAEAVYLSRLIADLLPEPEAIGLLALLLLHESRTAARTDASGDLVSLEQQDRALWDRKLVAEGIDLMRRSTKSGRLGSYAIQAAIAAVHAAADSVAATDWDSIIGYYDLLLVLQDSPLVALNRAIAVGMRDGPVEGLALVEKMLSAGTLSDYHRVYAAQADLARRAGLLEQARVSYRRAIELVRQGPERRYLERCLGQLSQ